MSDDKREFLSRGGTSSPVGSPGCATAPPRSTRRAVGVGAVAAAAAAAFWPPGIALAQTPPAAPDKRLEAARKEAPPTLYTGYTPTQIKALVSAFQAKFGIDVKVERLVTGKLIARYAAEAQANAVAADVVMQSDQLFAVDAAQRGWLAKLSAADVPSLAAWPAAAWVAGSYAPVVLLPWGFSYNSQKLAGADAPANWQDLLKPQHKGQILFTDPKATLSLLTNMFYLDHALGDDYLRGFAGQQFTLIPSLVPGLQQLAAGEKSILVQTIPGADAALLKAGAPIKTVIPEQHTGFAHYAGVSAKAPSPNAARLLLDFMLSRDGQAALVANSGYSMLDGIPGALPGNRFELTDWEEMAKEKQRLYGLLGI